MMKRLLLTAIILALLVVPVLALDPPSGDYANYGIAYTQPEGAGWYVSEIRHIPVGANGGYPGNHNIYVNTYDWEGWPNDPETAEWALHIPVRHVQVAYWCSGEDTPSPNNEHWVVQETWPDSPDGEGLDFPLFSQNTCKVAVWEVGVPSSIVSGIHTRHPDEGEDVRVGHHSFRIFFTRLESAEPTPRPTPTPAPTWTPGATVMPVDAEQMIREASWNHAYPVGGVRFNPSAAFQALARTRGYGAPVTNEFDIDGYRVQGFVLKILWAGIGDWDNIMELEW